MKKIHFIFFALVIFSGCSKTIYKYDLKELEDCIGEGLEGAREVKHDIETFDKGIYVYQNCRGYEDIDGVKVKWLEDENCEPWRNYNQSYNSSTPNLTIYSLTNEKKIPQRFFLIFLDQKRVLYFTNHESAKFFERHIKYIYNTPMDSVQMDKLIDEKIKSGIERGFFRIRKKKKSKPMDYAFMPLNWHNWQSKYTYNQIIPIQEEGWKKHMHGVFKTYKNYETGNYYVKISFDKGSYTVKEKNKKGGYSGGLVELLFQTDSVFKKLKLLEMNIPDSSVNLQSENEKGARRRNLLIKDVFAIQPVFECKNEPVKLSFTKNGKTKIIEKIILTEESSKHKEVWKVNGVEEPAVTISGFWSK